MAQRPLRRKLRPISADECCGAYVGCVCHGGNRGRIIMFKLAVWTVAIALQTVSLGIISTRAADDPFGSNLTSVTVAAVAQPMLPAPKKSASLSQTPELHIPHKYKQKRTSPRNYTPYFTAQSCTLNGDECFIDHECCSKCCVDDVCHAYHTYCE